MKQNRGIMRVRVAVITIMMALIGVQMVGAQQPSWECWGALQACERNAQSAEQFSQMCCPVVVNQMIGMNRGCFCLAGTVFPQRPDFAQAVAGLLSLCGAPTFDSICSAGGTPSPTGTPSATPPMASSPTGTPSVPPMNSPPSPTGTPSAPPMNSPPSPSGTPSAPPTGSTPSPIVTPSATPPSPSTPISDVTPTAPTPDSSTDETPPAVVPPPVDATPSDAPPTAEEPAPSDDTEADESAANKMTMTGSLSSLFILFTYILFN